MEYPKIETLWTRDEHTFRVKPGELRLPEFGLPRSWLITEKIDGTNIRITLRPKLEPPDLLSYGGRTNAAQVPLVVSECLSRVFPFALVASAFDPDTSAILYGEAYGPEIQKGGVYRGDIAVRLLDVVVFGGDGRPWWLNWANVEDVARKLGVKTVPVVAREVSLDDAANLVSKPSVVAQEDGGVGCDWEGIVARTDPLLFMRTGGRVMWKLKRKDYR